MARVSYPPVPARRGPAGIERLFWRAGFGPTASQLSTYSKRGLGPAIESLMRPPRQRFSGKPLRFRDGERMFPIQPLVESDNDWAQEVLWLLDKMVRTRAPLVERMTLNLHDHFATGMQKVNDRAAMLEQNELLRRNALGSFQELCRAITRDHAMQQWLDLVNSDPKHPNENYAREFMELFTIGPVHSQKDVEEIARAFTGFRFDWDTKRYWFDPDSHDDGAKTIFGKRGNWNADDAVRLCLEHPNHAPFLCAKMWRYFVPTPPSSDRLAILTRNYVASGWNLGVLVRTILRSPELYSNLNEPDMVKPPVVHLVGALRSIRAPYLQSSFRWQLDQMGQMPFHPPDVSGWDQGESFLSTGLLKARFEAMGSVLQTRQIAEGSISIKESPEQALALARKQVGAPWESAATRAALKQASRKYVPKWDGDKHFATERRLVLRHLLLAGPDACMH